ncbi:MULTISPECIES: type IX secretion system periplasmic lipoprotein PorW/SprE [Chryseobacterium]|uniref:type IX secretion system periplasmic lipoprotein PorW/SprE n=1 Tax=Chryseobacterium sp. R2A-55 TaxID=2744445 RepID=UPI001F364618|nr:tetratricopeptide repeat protein [Chryseobacterium sp. R2A-55]
MKKAIFFLLAFTVLSSCSSRKKANKSTFLKGFFTYYNTLFNSKDALQTEFKNRDKSHKDNFYDPYIPLLTYEDQPLGSDLGSSGSFGSEARPGGAGSFGSSGPGVPGSGMRPTDNPGNKTGATILEISEAKALKAIAKYSVMKGGVEKNKAMFDANILLAQSRLYRGKVLEALDGLNYIFNNMPKDKRIPLAKIYQGLAYSKMGDFSRSGEVFAELKGDKIKKDYQKLLSIYYSEMLLQSGKKDQAVDELSNAYALNKNRKLRSRIAFLRGQILNNLGRSEEARESFVSAYKNANDFEFEVKSQIEIAKTFNGKGDDYEGAKAYLEKIGKKGTYASRKNEFLYALGLMANKAGKKEEAQEYFAQSLKEKMSDPQIRGLDYFEIGKGHFEKSDYLAAGAYYDSALSVMTYEPTKILLEEQSKNIKQVSANYFLVKKNDSIIALTKMPENERIAYFTKVIDRIKEKEAREELIRKQAERNKGFDTGDYGANSIFAGNNGGFQDFGDSGKGGFYFSNMSTVSKGESTFKQIWGNRSLGDNWRTSARTTSIEDLKNEAMGIASAPDPRRLEPSFYIEKIPTDADEILALKKARDTASLGLGRMYDAFFSDTPLATKTLYDLVDNKPVEEVELPALYQIFVMNYEKNPSAAERAKQKILTDFPYTSYAEFVKNPKNTKFSASAPEVEKAYSEAYDLYAAEKYDESKASIENSLGKYPNDALVPKFALLNAFNTGKTAGKEIMILQLEQIALNYAKTPEGEKAKEMLKYLKSELELQKTDEKGNMIKENSLPLAKPESEPVRNNPRAENPGQMSTGPGAPGANIPQNVQQLENQKLKVEPKRQ